MKSTLPCLLFAALALTACISFGDDAPDPGEAAFEPAAATPTAAAVAVPAVSAFEGLTYDGGVLGVWAAAELPQWSVRSVASGESVTVREVRRTDCCIHFEERNGSPMVADFQKMEVEFDGATLPIGDVVQ